MKVAVIGAGSMGGMHADVLGAMDDVDGLYVVDADAARADEVARRNGGSAVTFEEALRGGRRGSSSPRPRSFIGPRSRPRSTPAATSCAKSH